MNTLTVNEGVALYNANCAHTSTIVGFCVKGYEYVALLEHINPAWCYWSTSRGKTMLRMHLSEKAKRELIKMPTCEYIGKTSDIFAKRSKYNKGEQFERYLYRIIVKQAWHKDCTPWDEGSDIETPVYKIQIKRENCTISSLKRLEKYN